MCLVMAEQHEKCVNKRCRVGVVLVIKCGEVRGFQVAFFSVGQKALHGARIRILSITLSARA